MQEHHLLRLLIAATVCAHGQTGASVEGKASDPAGQPIPDVMVRLIEIETNVTRSTVSGEFGTFRFANMTPGSYRLQAEKTGFKTFVREPLRVLVGTPLRVDIALQIGDVVERITVEETAAPTLNTVDASRGSAIQEEEIKRLPFAARNPVNLLTLQPGVIFTGNTDTDALFLGSTQSLDPREGVVNGVRGNQSNITIDGSDANDWENQLAFASALPVTLDSLQEFRVTTTNANSTDGGAGGAQVMLVTKSGTNELHGNARWYHRNTATAANAFFNNRIGLKTPKLLRNIGGVSAGGPILRNRLFFFGDFEMRRDTSESTELRIVPSETLRQGIVRYRTTVNTIATITPDQFRALDPAGLGVNQSVLKYFALFPTPNEVNAGDGLNQVGFRFNAPIGVNNELYTGRVDYAITPDGPHSAFWRGSLGDIAVDQTAATYPGQPAASRLLNNSGGWTAGYTGQLSAGKVNSFRWGYTRQSIESSGVPAPRLNLLSSTTTNIDNLLASNSPAGRRVPTLEIRDDLSLVSGRHTIQAGGSLRFVRNNRFAYANSFPIYRSFQTDCAGFCREMVNVLQTDGNPNNDPAIAGQVSDYSTVLTGLITNVQATFLADPRAQQFLPTGSPQQRSFAEDGFELYIQDAWRIRPSLLITAGLRYSYYTPIWETGGAQVKPNVDLEDYWNTLRSNMDAGKPADAMAPLSWILAGKGNKGPAWYRPDRNNFAPRLALTWTPVSKTVIRAGAGVYFDRVGGALGSRLDSFGSPGVSSTLVTPTGQVNLSTGVRFSGSCDATGCTGLPPVTDFLTQPSSPQFPFTPPLSGRGAGFMVDNHLRNPYSMNLSFSVQRELPKSVVVDVGYVGVLGRRSLQKIDFAQFQGATRDPQSGQTFWEAQNAIAQLIGDNPSAPAVDYRNLAAVRGIGPIPFFENMMENLPAFTNNPTLSPTQAFYIFQASRAPDWARTTPPLDVNLTPGRSPWSRSVDPEQDGWVMSPRQFQALPTWTNAGSSNFHSLQISARKTAGSALFGFNYVLSKSIDNGSQPENQGSNLTGMIPNAFFTGAARSVSAFDVRHNLNAHWVWELPVGPGRLIRTRGALAELLLGSWSTTGVTRWRTGFPIRLGNGPGRATSVQLGGPGTAIGPLEPSIVRNGPDGYPNIFPDAAAAYANTRPTISGGVGTQYVFYGPAYWTVDLGANKRFRLPWRDSHEIEFRATAFNALNRTNFRFEQINGGSSPAVVPGFGRITETVGPRGGARELEFALRYEF